MSAEIILLIVGAVLLLIAIGDSIKIKGSAVGLVNIRLKLILGMLGVLMIIYGGYSFGLVNPQTQIEQVEVGNKLQVQYPIEKVRIISPLEGDSVKCRILTMGVYPESHDKDIWVVLNPPIRNTIPNRTIRTPPIRGTGNGRLSPGLEEIKEKHLTS
jgi:hypothetical protein